MDGQLVSSGANSFALATAAGNVTIGASLEGTDEHLNGRMFDVRFYNRPISQGEVAELYGLVGRWMLNETSGTTATDTSGAGNHGTYGSGIALNGSGPFPGAGAVAADFSGAAASYVSVPYSPQFDNSSFSVGAWVNTDNINKAGSNGVLGTRLGGDNTFDVKVGSNVIHGDVGNGSAWLDVLVDIRAVDTGSNGQGGDLKQSHWYFITYVVDNQAQQARLYLDGDLKRTISISGTPRFMKPGQTIMIGNSSGTETFDGRLQGVCVYNRSLSAAEVAALYGLVGHWKFDEGSGTTQADSSGVGTNAANNGGAPAWVSGVYSNGLQFNGTTDDVRTISPFAPPSAGTVAFWMRPDGMPASTRRILGNGGDWEVRQYPDGLVYLDLCGDNPVSTNFTTVSALTNSNRWYHVLGTYDSADDSYAVYVNGVLERSGTSVVNMVAQAANHLSFGTRTGTTERFAGALDDIRVYNRKMSAWEAYEVFGLMAWYKLDETSGTVAIDSTGRGQDGAYSGSPTLNVSANGAASQGTAAAFNGSNYMQAPGLYEKSSSVSAAAWVRLDGADSLGSEVVSLGDCFLLRLNSGSSGAVAKYYNGSAWITATASQTVLNTGWHHFAAVLDGGSTLKLYIDGVEAASTAASGAISYTGQGANTRVASHANGFTNVDLTGRVDDVRIFNRALKPDEVFQMYRGSRINGIKILTWVETR
jgi:hypothetical protein